MPSWWKQCCSIPYESIRVCDIPLGHREFMDFWDSMDQGWCPSIVVNNGTPRLRRPEEIILTQPHGLTMSDVLREEARVHFYISIYMQDDVFERWTTLVKAFGVHRDHVVYTLPPDFEHTTWLVKESEFLPCYYKHLFGAGTVEEKVQWIHARRVIVSSFPIEADAMKGNVPIPRFREQLWWLDDEMDHRLLQTVPGWDTLPRYPKGSIRRTQELLTPVEFRTWLEMGQPTIVGCNFVEGVATPQPFFHAPTDTMNSTNEEWIPKTGGGEQWKVLIPFDGERDVGLRTLNLVLYVIPRKKIEQVWGYVDSDQRVHFGGEVSDEMVVTHSVFVKLLGLENLLCV